MDALDCLEQARRIAEREGHMNELRRINCMIGVSRGITEFVRYTQGIKRESQPSYNESPTTF